MNMTIKCEILSYIERNDVGVGFYHIARRFGLPSAPYDLPAVVQQMVSEGFVEVMDGHSIESYRLTEKGRQAMSDKWPRSN